MAGVCVAESSDGEFPNDELLAALRQKRAELLARLG